MSVRQYRTWPFSIVYRTAVYTHYNSAFGNDKWEIKQQSVLHAILGYTTKNAPIASILLVAQ